MMPTFQKNLTDKDQEKVGEMILCAVKADLDTLSKNGTRRNSTIHLQDVIFKMKNSSLYKETEEIMDFLKIRDKMMKCV